MNFFPLHCTSIGNVSKAKQGNLNLYIWVQRVYALVNYFGSFLSGRMEQLPPIKVAWVWVSASTPLSCRWSLLLLIFSALRGLSPGAPVFPSPEKPNANSLWKSSPMNDTGDTHRATSLSVLRSVKFTPLRHHLLLFFFYCLSKNCFLPVDLARLYQGTTNLGQNRWKNNIPLPTPNQG